MHFYVGQSTVHSNDPDNEGNLGNREDYPRLRLFARSMLALGVGLAVTACTYLENPQSNGTQPTVTPPQVLARSVMRPVDPLPSRAPNIFPVLSLGTDARELKKSLEKIVAPQGVEDEDSLWPHLTREFTLDHHLNQRAVQDAVKKYTNNPEWLAAAQERISLYLPYFLEEVKRRKLPAELALLPIIESTLDPSATSPRGALGLWQFMPDTANRFGLSRDWWHDSRMDTVASTRAALDYLELLHAQFDDWLLTMAAYNAGEGTVARTMPGARARTNDSRFFSMHRLPAETRSYVPRVLALAAIIKDPARYDIVLPSVAKEVLFETVTMDKPVDLNLAATILNVLPSELVALNPGFHRQATPPEGSHNLLVPARSAEFAQARLDAMAADGLIAPIVEYRVRRGDSLNKIARSFNSSVGAITSLNGLRSDHIAANATLRIPRAGADGKLWTAGPSERLVAAVSARPTSIKHRVKRGETLSTIAKRYDISVGAVMTANRITNHRINADRVLTIPLPAIAQNTLTTQIGATSKSLPRASAQARWPERAADVSRATTAYRIRPGDSLSAIASRHGITTAELRSMNGLRRDTIRAHQTLRVPSMGSESASQVAAVGRESYRVRSGDTLWSIALRHSVSRQELMRVNGLQTSSVLSVGKQLKIPQPAPADIAGG